MSVKCSLGIHCNHSLGYKDEEQISKSHGKFNKKYKLRTKTWECCKCGKKSTYSFRLYPTYPEQHYKKEA